MAVLAFALTAALSLSLAGVGTAFAEGGGYA